MITLVNLTGAFLRNKGNVLLIKRGMHKKIAPGMWSGIGGRIENAEMNTPQEAALRELEEESGILRQNISSLELQYILIGKHTNYIGQTYVYFGETSQSEIIQCDEGEIAWIPEEELLNRKFSDFFEQMLRHHMARSPKDKAVYVGVADDISGEKLHITWTPCVDF